MKVWKDKQGKKLTAKEFTQRFKEGIENITPIQKLKNDLFSSVISFIGFVGSIVVLIIFRKDFVVTWFSYMLILIFLGSAWSSGIKILMIRQQLKFFKNTENSAMSVKDILEGLNKEKGE